MVGDIAFGQQEDVCASMYGHKCMVGAAAGSALSCGANEGWCAAGAMPPPGVPMMGTCFKWDRQQDPRGWCVPSAAMGSASGDAGSAGNALGADAAGRAVIINAPAVQEKNPILDPSYAMRMAGVMAPSVVMPASVAGLRAAVNAIRSSAPGFSSARRTGSGVMVRRGQRRLPRMPQAPYL